MVHVPPIEQADQKRILRSMTAFLEKQQNLGWILGVIGTQKTLALQLLTTRLVGYGDSARYAELKAKLEERHR